MPWAHLASGVLVLVGFLVMAANALGRPRGMIAPFRRREIDPHLWGFHLLGMGLLMETLLFLLQDPGWRALSPVARATAALAGAWVLIAGWLALAALVAPASPSRRRRGFIPPPKSRPRSWPAAYRFFLGAGFASLLVLAFLVLTTP